MRQKNDTILLVNPWIYDFAAYDYWIKPIGLLYLGRYLEQHGYRCDLLDCLDRTVCDPALLPHGGKFGMGKFPVEEIPRPALFAHIPRVYKRYGVPPSIIRERLQKLEHRPSAILITSMMTYWYPGVLDAVLLVKELFPNVPVLLGGVYATLCSEHARKTMPVDQVITSPDAEQKTLNAVDAICGVARSSAEIAPFDVRTIDRPAYHLYGKLLYASMITSLGCPMRCQYCASSLLQPQFIERDPHRVFDELRYYAEERGVQDVAFFDDALLINPEKRIIPLLEKIIAEKLPVRLHTPNGLHVRAITPLLADLLYRAQVKTLFLSFESSDLKRQKDSSSKLTNSDFSEALRILYKTGFTKDAVGVYMLIGLPDQTKDEVEDSIRFLHSCGARIAATQYSPIPGTPYYERARAAGTITETDPLFHNRAAFPLGGSLENYRQFEEIKNTIRQLNARL